MPMPIPGPGMTPKYSNPDELTGLIEKYFASCWEEDWREEYVEETKLKQWVQKFDHEGKPIMKLRQRPTVTGLALALGFTTRQALLNYQNKDAFAPIIERAKLAVEYYYEHGGAEGSIHPATTIFALKNFGWTDVIQIKGADTNERLTPDDVTAQIDAVKKRLTPGIEDK